MTLIGRYYLIFYNIKIMLTVNPKDISMEIPWEAVNRRKQ